MERGGRLGTVPHPMLFHERSNYRNNQGTEKMEPHQEQGMEEPMNAAPGASVTSR
jgi:hypothetical protein